MCQGVTQVLERHFKLFQGLTKSLIESPPTAEGIQTSEREMATSVGFVLGFLFGGFLLARFSRNFIMLLTLQVLGSMLITVPWIDSDWATDTVYIIIGVCIAILMIGEFSRIQQNIFLCKKKERVFPCICRVCSTLG